MRAEHTADYKIKVYCNPLRVAFAMVIRIGSDTGSNKSSAEDKDAATGRGAAAGGLPKVSYSLVSFYFCSSCLRRHDNKANNCSKRSLNRMDG